jgi:dipeptidyl aminopeptidase/acylaminoacyl peptidase
MMFLRSAAKDSVTRARDDSAVAARAARATAAGGRGGAAPTAAAPGAGGRGGQADSTTRATRPDTLFHWAAPFTGEAALKPLYVTSAPGTIGNVNFDDSGRIMFVTQTMGGATTTDAIFLDENNAKFTVTRGGGGGGAAGGRGGAGGGGRGGAGGGGGAGALETMSGSRGVNVVMTSTDGKFVFRRGTAPDSTRGPRPYIEKIDIRTGTATKVYESAITDLTETIGAPLDRDFTKFLATRQSAKQPPQQFIVDAATKEAKLVRQATDLMPEITNAVKLDVMAKRADGYSFRIRVTLPADYKPGSNPRYPAMFWFYPREYNDQAAYDASLGGGGRGNSNGPGTFPSTPGVRSMAFLTAAGYALIEPDAPIFATEGRLPNDNYVVDLRNDLAATIDALDTLGIIDRHRLGIGGHSYGAFSAVNAMVHTPYFKAGIAGDGAYNRTLTPNGFQSERRDFWQARDTYLAMSPFLFANQLNGALLLYHSTDDQNVGTHPINSERLYHALMGQGKDVSLYMYPYEDHGPIARETVLDQWARWVAWLDKYVKNANAPKVSAQ